jgi:hypothetical protein
LKLIKGNKAPMNLAIPDVRTLEIHPPTFGYLTSCRRSDGPGRGNDLGVPLLKTSIRDAAALGYNFLSIGGEQSIFYPELASLCREAHHMRMLTTLTTRAGLLSARRIKSLVPSIDLLGIRYEAGMARNLEPVRGAGIPFALVFHLTETNMGELEATAAFAVSHGAAMLHVQPDEKLSEQAMATVWMMIECLRDMHRGELALQVDVLHRYNLREDAANLYTWLHNAREDATALGELVSCLVIEEDGFVTPFRHGFSRSMGLGFLGSGTLNELVVAWIRNCAADFCEVYRKVLQNAGMFDDIHNMLSTEISRGSSRKVLQMRMASSV